MSVTEGEKLRVKLAEEQLFKGNPKIMEYEILTRIKELDDKFCHIQYELKELKKEIRNDERVKYEKLIKVAFIVLLGFLVTSMYKSLL